MKRHILPVLSATLLSFAALANDPFVEENALGVTDWTNGYVEAQGQGSARYMGSKVQEELMAKQAARTMAQARLLELVKGIRVTGLTTLGEHAQSDTRAATRVKGTLRGAKSIKENVTWHEDKTARRGEVVMAEVTLRLCVSQACSDSPQNLTNAVFEQKLQPGEQKKEKLETTGPSSVIIDLQQALYFPALSPEVIDENGSLIYAQTTVGAQAQKDGLVQYAKTVQAAKELDQSGPSPLIISALKVSKDNKIVVSQENAERLQDVAALREGRLIVALD